MTFIYTLKEYKLEILRKMVKKYGFIIVYLCNIFFRNINFEPINSRGSSNVEAQEPKIMLKYRMLISTRI